LGFTLTTQPYIFLSAVSISVMFPRKVAQGWFAKLAAMWAGWQQWKPLHSRGTHPSFQQGS